MCLSPRSTLYAAAVITGIVLLAIPVREHTDRAPARPTIPVDLSCGPSSLLEASAALDPRLAARVRTVLAGDTRASRPVTSLHDLATWAAAAGLDPIGLRLDVSELEQLPLPVVVHLNPNHFVALVELSKEHALVIDQGSVVREIPLATFEQRFSGNALCLGNLPPRAGTPEG